MLVIVNARCKLSYKFEVSLDYTAKIAAGRRKHKTEKLLSCARGHNISPKCSDSAKHFT